MAEQADCPWLPKAGDVVRLKSGGPRMTVRRGLSFWAESEYIAPDGRPVVCDWFKGSQVRRGLFPSDSLVPWSQVADYERAEKDKRDRLEYLKATRPMPRVRLHISVSQDDHK